jgi:hypothetical protein
VLVHHFFIQKRVGSKAYTITMPMSKDLHKKLLYSELIGGSNLWSQSAWVEDHKELGATEQEAVNAYHQMKEKAAQASDSLKSMYGDIKRAALEAAKEKKESEEWWAAYEQRKKAKEDEATRVAAAKEADADWERRKNARDQAAKEMRLAKIIADGEEATKRKKAEEAAAEEEAAREEAAERANIALMESLLSKRAPINFANLVKSASGMYDIVSESEVNCCGEVQKVVGSYKSEKLERWERILAKRLETQKRLILKKEIKRLGTQKRLILKKEIKLHRILAKLLQVQKLYECL